MKDAHGFETGFCQFTVKFRVTTYTSGNELPGPAVHFGDYTSYRDAQQVLADCGFTNGEFGWRKGYTDADIRKVIEYGDPIPAPDPVKAATDQKVYVIKFLRDDGTSQGDFHSRTIFGKEEFDRCHNIIRDEGWQVIDIKEYSTTDAASLRALQGKGM